MGLVKRMLSFKKSNIMPTVTLIEVAMRDEHKTCQQEMANDLRTMLDQERSCFHKSCKKMFS